MRSRVHFWWDESDRRQLHEVSVRRDREAEVPDSSQGRETTFPTACWGGKGEPACGLGIRAVHATKSEPHQLRNVA